MTDYSSVEPAVPHRSPAGRQVKALYGEPGNIEDRGQEIEDLGRKMRDSADTLQSIKDRAAANQGKAIDSFRKSIGDSHETLREAADLYEPVGPVIREYGSEISDLQPEIGKTVVTCGDLWEKYESLPGDKGGRGVGGWLQPDEGSDEAEEQAAEDDAKKAAYDEWKTEGDKFDCLYESWEEAFDTAVNGITDAEAGTIEDSGWDKFWEAMNGLSDVLAVVGAGLAIAALFISGPIGWVALGVGVAAFAVDGARYLHGDASGGELAMSALGAVPFGKAGTGLIKATGKGGEVAATAERTAAQSARFGGEIGPGTQRVGDAATRSVFGRSTGDLARNVMAPLDTGGKVGTTAGYMNLFGGMADQQLGNVGTGKTIHDLVTD